jgi:flavin-dependent dehydrogenase
LIEAKVEFLLASFVTDLLRDDAGKICGVVMANRAGRQAVLAKVIVDATPEALLARLAGAAGRCRRSVTGA